LPVKLRGKVVPENRALATGRIMLIRKAPDANTIAVAALFHGRNNEAEN
jgi:hypothetical protein